MAEVFLSLGSNVNREHNIASCMCILQSEFYNVQSSIIYESESVGFKGRNFFNSVVRMETELTLGELSSRLRDIEHDHGRDRSAPKFGSRTLDIDILTFNKLVGTFEKVTLPRAEILYNAFVLRPLADIAPKHLHPVTLKCYQQLWDDFDKTSQNLWPSTFRLAI